MSREVQADSCKNGIGFIPVRQLLWDASFTCENKTTSLMTLNAPRGEAHRLERVFSDVDDLAIKLARIYNPNNPKHTERELARYVNAAERDFRGCLHVTMSCTDATKVGTNFSIACATFLNKKKLSEFQFACRG